jgi:DNA-binding NarL/FixJ family response regulator
VTFDQTGDPGHPAGRAAASLASRNDSPSSTRSGEASETEQGKTRILVVEDDFLIALQTEAALTDAGFEVIGSATTAEEAIALATAQQPCLAVMDIRLASERDGIDAASQLFKEFGIRCIFATAHDDPHTRRRAEPYAPLGWLAKPYTMTSLVTLVVEALSRLD